MPHQISCVAYVRVSTDRQAGEKLTSLADQERAIRELAARLGAEVGNWFRDAGASGATVEGRPAFLELLAWCESHQRHTIDRGLLLVLNASRFGRFDDHDEAAYWRHHLYRLGWVVRYVEGDAEGDAAPIVRAVASVEASTYRRNLIANTRRGMRGAANQGLWTREAPYGFRRQVVHPPSAARVLERGQRKVDGEKVRLTPHPEEARHIRWAFRTYAAGGISLQGLADELHRRAPVRKWGRTVLATMLQNPAYRGAVVGGVDGEPYGLEDAHEALVDREVWYAVQRRLEVNAERGRGVRTEYLLSGLLRCVYCGEAYTGGGGGRSRNRNPERSHRRFYRDNGGVAGTCPGRIGTIMRHLIDDAAVELVATTLEMPAMRRKVEHALQEDLERRSGTVGERDAELRVTERRLEQERGNLLEAIAGGFVLAAEASGHLERIRAAIADVTARRQALRFDDRRVRAARSERDRLIAWVYDFSAVVQWATGPELRRAVEPWLGAVTFDKVGRVLNVGIRCLPAVPSLVLSHAGGPARREEGGLIVRSRSLVQPGHRYRIAAAEDALARGTA